MPGIDVVGVIAVHVVREATLFPELEEEATRHSLAEDRVQHVDDELVRMVCVDGAPSDAEVGLLGTLSDQLGAHLSGAGRRDHSRRLAWCERSERTFDRGDRLIRVQRPGERDDRPRGCVSAFDEGTKRVGGHPEDDLFAARDLPAERVFRIEQLVEQRMHAVLRLIAIHSELLDDHASLRFDVRGAQHRCSDHVRHHVERDQIVACWHARPEDSDLLIGGGVHHSPTALDLLADVRGRRPLPRPLEHHVFEEMARARVALALDARSDPHVDGHRDRSCLGHLRDEDTHAVRERDAAVLQRLER